MYSLEDLRGEIDAHIAARLEVLPRELGVDVSANGERVYKLLREFALRPGKRIRGALAMVAYDMFGGKNHRAALDLALAVELVQNYLLIVDDVMDRSELRRGGQTIHRQYQGMLQREYATRDFEHLGNMIGVNVGLIAQHFAVLVLSSIDELPERVLRAERIFQTNVAATGFGQMDDLMNEAGQPMTLDDVRHMYMLKSSYYSFVNPLQLGAVLAGADDGVLEPIKQFGERAGLAFQLQDDLLGMFGDQHITGKSSLDDLREGKMTLLVRHALKAASPAELRTLKGALGNKDVTSAQHTAVQAVLVRLGSRDYVAQEARAAAQAALGTLTAQPWNVSGKAFLTRLMDYIVVRER